MHNKKPDEGVEEVEKVEKVQKTEERSASSSGVLAGLLFYVVIALLCYAASATFRTWINNHLYVPAIIAVLVAGSLFFARFRTGGPTARIGLVIFVVIPLIAGLFIGVSVLSDSYQIAAYRWFFIVLATTMPASLFYLFIVGRKRNLLQEYLTNINRMGLLGKRGDEGDRNRDIRVHSYVQKFEVAYGPLPEGMASDVIDGTRADPSSDVVKALLRRNDDMGAVFTLDTALPVVGATALIFLGWLLTLPPWEEFAPGTDKWSVMFAPQQLALNYAFLGAYFFCFQMLFRRYVRKDLRANAYVGVCLRIVLSFIGIWVVEQAWDTLFGEQAQDALMVVAFVVGAFPPVAWQVARSAFQKITLSEFFVPSLRTAMPVNDLDGLTVWHEARLQEEDVENIPNMATADLVELMLNTRFPPNRIIDWMDQAILYTQLGSDSVQSAEGGTEAVVHGLRNSATRIALAQHGIRSATALLHRCSAASADPQGELRALHDALATGEEGRLESLLRTLETNDNLELVVTWKRLPDAS
ncbi:MAG: hypothetical protein AAGI72_02250 [Pseudomonadota bacterium]